ncbi:MAG TPA: hypothetical protein VJR02_23190 [Pyrinomonadaceae bacterium]|nr:hypothetical protein [Pyrinomonadaceae bacterium]
MSRNDANDYAQRLYARVPAYYRVLDEEQGMPLYALLATVGEQVANIRADLEALWDDFFIETCEDWVVPYLAGLTGTHLLANPVGQSNRLDVRNTVMWRRSKGTPAMLRALAQAISGWPTDLAEFFQVLGWSQNMNHLRLHSKLTPDLRDTHALSLLGTAADPFSHAADFKTARALSQARVVPESLGIGRAAWATPGRYQIKNLGFFERRLQTFAINGATPAAAAPGLATPADAACFTFDPLFRDTPLFVKDSGEPLTRAAFGHAPWETFGTDVAVRQFGVLLASNAEPLPPLSNSQTPFSFGNAGAGLQLHATDGLRLLSSAQTGDPHFVITAGWFDSGTITGLGSLSTLHAAFNDGDEFHAGVATPGPGHLVIQIQTGRASLGWPGMSTSPAGRFPGAVIAVRATRTGAVHQNDGIYVYLPSAYLTSGDVLTLHVSDDGSTYRNNDFSLTSLERDSEGQVFPPRALTSSTRPASDFTILNRQRGALRLPDPQRFGNAEMYFQVDIFTGAFQPLAAIATAAQASGAPDFPGASPWPAFTSRPSLAATNNTAPEEGLLAVLVRPLSGDFIPASELVVTNRSGESLLIYLPEITGSPAEGVRFFVADDGSTFFAPADVPSLTNALGELSLAGLELSRESAGQVLPIPGRWPLQYRRPTAINLCRCERRSLLKQDELGIDPELGRFALSEDDPILTVPLPGDVPFTSHALTVDYVEAFSGRVGARTFDRGLDTAAPPTILVSQSGDAASLAAPNIPNNRLHSSLASALAVAIDNDVIEIVDSATYLAPAEIVFQNPVVHDLTIRAAAGQRPCLSFYTAAGAPIASSMRIRSPLDSLEINGLLISGGPVEIESNVKQFNLLGCTLDPRSTTAGWSLRASDSDLNHQAVYLVCRSITGGLRIGAGIDRLNVADSIVDQQGSVAIGELPFVVSPPAISPIFSPSITSLPTTPTTSNVLQLERVTVLGRIECDVLQASECLLNDLAVVDDQQSGCIRFSRWERGSILPRRFQCVPNEAQARDCPPNRRCLPAQFNSLRFGRPDYAQLGAMRQPEILSASESGAEVGAFASELNQIRLANLQVKLREFMPVSLTAVVVAET